MDNETSETHDRGVSELLGLVLLFGMVAVGIAAILLAGSVAVDSIQEEASVSSAQMGMHELDARVGDTASGPVGIDLGSRDGAYRVVRNGSVSFTVNEQANCSATTPLGSVQYHDRRGNRLAYEAGGIWRLDSDGGVSMVSPPEIEHRDGTLSMDLTNISGQFDGGQAVMRSAETDDEDIVEQLYRGGPGCFPPENITVTVESRFYEAWGRFFADRLNESTTVVDDSTGTASVRLPIDSAFAADASNDSVTSSTQFNATVELLGTELSGLDNSSEIAIYGLTTFRIVADGDEYTPWPDGDPDDGIAAEAAEDDVNDPTEGEHQSYQLTDREQGTAITVRATSWTCNDWEDSYQDITVDGTSYDQHRCEEANDKRISLNSSGESSNLVVLEDGEAVPNFGAAGAEQRGLDEILGSRIDGTGTLQLAPNEFVFLYELSEENADPANAGGSGDPDYNDAVVLVTIEQSWNNTGDLSIRIEKDQIIVEDDEEENSLAVP
ncbi:DUF7289 family protein [Haloarchaeobius iranensis]|uniref:Flagellin N-terminal-like domain-containing protein n=1 Tax=Haloarchaeobius iranensis TaxID=996166 RepID=A0A1G9X0W9_9EURY|nr:hypothetical protein [Haloarchaeobius iranensis]SDM90086.1 hypothetical protein SAMN05192554_10978 [Haloarchaeobius iranensis]